MTLVASPFRPRHFNGDPESWNVLLGFSGQALPLARAGATLSFEQSDAPNETAVAIGFSIGDGTRLAAVIENAPLAAIFDTSLDMAEVWGLAPLLRDAMLRGLLALLWEALPKSRFETCVVEAVCPWRGLAFDRAMEWFRFEVKGIAPGVIEGRLGCAQGALASLLLSGAIAPSNVNRALRERLFADVFISLERAPVSIGEMRSLKSGDLFVLSEKAGARLLLRAARARWDIIQGDGPWIIDAVAWSGATDNDRKEVVDAEENDEALDVSRLVIDVDFDIGRVSRPLSEIESWRPGSVIELDPPSIVNGLEVTLRVNGAPVGVGELISVDERLAVRIARWSRD